MRNTDPGELGFTFEARKNGEVIIRRHGQLIATLRGRVANEFLALAESADEAGLQQLLARITGNYKRGNERRARNHPRNRP